MTRLTRARRNLVALIALLLVTLVPVGPQVICALRFRSETYTTVSDTPPASLGVVFGAFVYPNATLSDAARERLEAGAHLYHAGRVETLLISGDERSNNQATAIAAAAVNAGVPVDALLIDTLGIDTRDTCRHAAQIASRAILVTQGYHLPRAMLMCQRDGLQVAGLAANHLDLLTTRGRNAPAIAATRLVRFYREAFLTWAYLLGAYDELSDEAEKMVAAQADALPSASKHLYT